MRDKKTLTFDIPSAQQFSLVAAGRGDNKHYTLKYGDEILSGLSQQALQVLEFLAERSDRICSRDDILDKVSEGSGHNLVDQYVSDIRAVFLAADPACPKFINAVSGEGYRFLPKIHIDGDLGSVTAYSLWDRSRFFELIKDVKRGIGDDGDIRITATNLGPSLEVLNFGELLQKRLRIKVLFMNPANEALMDSRFLLRSERDDSYQRCLREHGEQINDIQKLARRYPAPAREKRREPSYAFRPGELEFAISDSMPPGLIVHTVHWAVVGLFLAHTSYTFGPMLEIESRSTAWTELRADWDARWAAATTQPPKVYRRS
jgi:DNA-binding winged helix-turn-helix (wHTH) protein